GYVLLKRGAANAAAAFSPAVAHVNGLGFGARTWWLRRSLPASTAVVVQNHSDTGPMGHAPVARLIGAATRNAVDGFLFAADEHVSRWRRAGFIGPRQPTHQVIDASPAVTPIPRPRAAA